MAITDLAAKVMANEMARGKATQAKHGPKHQKLSIEQVREIRASSDSEKEIAEKFGITRYWIHEIRRGAVRKDG